MKKKMNRSGIALFFTIGTIVVISIISGFMIYFMRGEVHLSENYIDSTISLLLAEAGVEETLFTIKTQMNSPESDFYTLVTKQSEGSIDVDLTRLSKGEGDVAPIVKGGTAKAKVDWKLDEDASNELLALGVPKDLARQGIITINSMGAYHNTKKQVEVKKTLKALLIKGGLTSNALGMIAPNHGLYFNEAKQDAFKIDTFDFWDPWGFSLTNGKAYFKDGTKIDLPKWLMLTGMKNELEHPFLDIGMGWTGWSGGADFSSTPLEYTESPITRDYYKWQGLTEFPWWSESSGELYNSNTTRIEEYEAEKVNLYSGEVYKKLANRVIDPESNPSQGQYFTSVTFKEAYTDDSVTYTDVLPMYGWGKWQNVTNNYSRWFGDPTKAHDTSNAVEINGLTYVKGDVYLEGWVKGKGLLVVEGDIYVGGDILMLEDDSGLESCLGIIALREESDTSTSEAQSGRIIYQPHHDTDWSRFGITHPFRNISPRLEGSIYAEGGMEVKSDSTMTKLINMDIVGNFVTDFFDRRKMPNDVSITYYNWQEVLEKSTYDYTVGQKESYSDLYELAIQKEILSWREVTAVL